MYLCIGSPQTIFFTLSCTVLKNLQVETKPPFLEGFVYSLKTYSYIYITIYMFLNLYIYIYIYIQVNWQVQKYKSNLMPINSKYINIHETYKLSMSHYILLHDLHFMFKARSSPANLLITFIVLNKELYCDKMQLSQILYLEAVSIKSLIVPTLPGASSSRISRGSVWQFLSYWAILLRYIINRRIKLTCLTTVWTQLTIPFYRWTI